MENCWLSQQKLSRFSSLLIEICRFNRMYRTWDRGRGYDRADKPADGSATNRASFTEGVAILEEGRSP